ncbi:subtilase family protein [Motilibacter rhizosphaerae]|uniref:Subtilase family protein n=1 Tax=Motilibacter rhizosphaerae TaxID=598652 RepID=A0A4Q7NXU9_9ACTN|nr:subtilase family protein [Motilibacter rhizosphaerae]
MLLKDQHANLPASGSTLAARVAATSADQRSLVASAKDSGATDVRQLHVANAFAATVSAPEAAALAADHSVAAVVPDRLVAAPSRQTDTGGVPGATGTPRPTSSTVCPTDPAKPLLEPEALQLTHTAFNDPATPSANQIATGKGVTVAFFAEGIDVDNPDFIRPDGSHVIVDYQDFSGEGTQAPTSGGEAFGDASSIAAQGRQVYDISKVVSAAHPLPAGCTIRVQGVAPDAKLVAMKVFPAGGFAFNSAILKALDYAVTVDHADVLSESFGSNQYPDTGNDPTALFNEQLVAAGVTVVASSGDAGPANTIGSPASSPGIISAAATTSFRYYAQVGYRGFPLSNGSYQDDTISGLSSSGFTQAGRTVDLAAPGDLGWAVCTPDLDRFEDCVGPNLQPSPVYGFGGTSQSAPFIAGGAALVIQAYRDTHGGTSPAPALVRSLLTSTADDLGAPAQEQGAGLMNTLRAVKAARSAPGSSVASSSNDLLVQPSSVSVATESGSTSTATVSVTNLAAEPRTLQTRARTDGRVIGDPQTQQVSLDITTDPTFVDSNGANRAYVKTTFDVPAKAQRLTASIAYPGAQVAAAGGRVYLTLLNPDGTYAAHNLPQGSNDVGYVDVPSPKAGRWTAIVFTPKNAAGYSGPVQLTTTAYKDHTAATAPTVTLAPGETRDVSITVPQPHAAGDYSEAIVLGTKGASGSATTIVPLTLRTLVKLHAHHARFEGTLTGTNGRSGIPNPSLTYAFDVPAGTSALRASLSVPQLQGQALYGFLVDPNGEPVSERTNQRASGDSTTLVDGLDLATVNPQAGRWQLVIAQFGASEHTSGETGFRVDLYLDDAKVKAKGLPSGGTLQAGVPATATVHVSNRGKADAAFFADARLDGSTTQPLVVTGKDYTFTDAPLNPFPAVTVPTETTALTVSATASAPIGFEISPFPADHLSDLAFEGDPDVVAGPLGTSPSVTVTDPIVAPQTWLALPTAVGPVGPDGAGTISSTFSATAQTKAFDAAVTSSTGDPQLATVDAAAPAATPLVLGAGADGDITVTITPTGAPGTTVSGTLYIDTKDAVTGSVDEVAALPYSYTVGGSASIG